MTETTQSTALEKPENIPAHTKYAWTQTKFARAGKYAFYRLFRLSGEFTAIILGVALFWAIAINMVLARGSVDISFLDKNAGLWFSQAFDGQEASVGKMTLNWNPAGNSVIFRAADVSVTDEDDQEIQRVDAFSSEIGIARVLSGRLDPRHLTIHGGAVSWLRDADGDIKAGLGTPETVGKLGPVWTGQRASQKERGVFSLGGLETVTISDAVAYVRDKQQGTSLAFFDTGIKINNIADVFEFALKTNLKSAQKTTPITLDLKLSPDYKDFALGLKAVGLNPKDIAPDRGQLALLSGVDAPMDVDLSVLSTREIGLSHVDLDVTAGQGRLDSTVLSQNFDSAALTARYDTAAQALRVTQLNVTAANFGLKGAASLLNIGSPAEGFFKEAVGFSVDLDDLKIDAAPRFETAFDFESVNVAGQYLYAERATEFTRIDVDFGNFSTDLTGQVKRTVEGTFETIKLEGGIDGNLSPQDLVALWPQKFAVGGREWIKRAITSAEIKNIRLLVDIPQDALSTGRIENEHLNVTFDVANADVLYLGTMTPLTRASGQARLQGNAFGISVDQAAVGNLIIENGRVDIPVLNVRGGDVVVDINGKGAMPDLLALIDEPPLNLVSPYNFSPADFSGQGQVNFKLTRPLLSVVAPGKTQYSVAATLSDVSAPLGIGPHTISNGNVKLTSDNAGLIVNGPVKIGPWNADLKWREIFDEGATPSFFTVSGVLNRDDMDGFGVGFRQYFTGDVPLSIDAEGRGVEITQARIDADLTLADIQAGSYWAKARGVPGRFTGNLVRNLNGDFSINDLSIEAPALKLRGQLNMAQDYRLINLDLTEAKVDNVINAGLKVSPDPANERFSIYMTGDYLDVSAMLPKSVKTQSSIIDVPILLTAKLNQLILKPDYNLTNANVLYAHDGTGMTQARVKGAAKAGPFSLEVRTNTETARRDVDIDIPDASNAAMAFLGLDNIDGGRLSVRATLPLAGEAGPLRGEANIESFQLVDAPALAQMLSMASLTGLGNVLGGEGIKFDRFEVPFSLQDNLLQIRNARVSGPAIGLTGDGDMNLDTMALDFDGVLVPAYSANSVLGGIPIVGDILVGKKGEGIFALSYTVKGQYDKMQVVVNPLSALTPGFLRGIFKPSRKKMVDPELIKQIEAVKPPPEN